MMCAGDLTRRTRSAVSGVDGLEGIGCVMSGRGLERVTSGPLCVCVCVRAVARECWSGF